MKPLSSFFSSHPSLLPSLFFLLGISIAVCPNYALLIPFFFLSLFKIKKPKQLFLLYSLSLSAFLYGNHTNSKFPSNLQQIKGTATVFIHSLKQTKSHFKQGIFVQGLISSMETLSGEKIYNIPCSFPLPSYMQPLQFQSYLIQGTLEKKELYFSFTPDPDAPWRGIGNAFSLANFRFHTKKHFSSYIKKTYRDPTSADFLTALLLGDLEDRLLRFSFNKLGLQHILAISGFHFSLLSLFIGSFFKFLFKEKVALVLLLIVLTFYFILLGTNPSVMRAYLALVLYLVGRLGNYRPKALNLLGTTLLIELIISPQSVKSLGFQLSFLATASILFLFPLSFSWMERLLPKRTLFDSLLLHPFEKITYLFCCFLRSSLAINAAVSLTMVPTCLWYFNSFPLMSLIYNLFIPVAVSAGLFIFFLSLPFAWIPPLSNCLHEINELFIRKILQIVIESPNSLNICLTCPTYPLGFLYLYLFALFSYGIFHNIQRGRVFLPY